MLQFDSYPTTYKIISRYMLGTFLDTRDESALFHAWVRTSHASSFIILCFIRNISTSYTQQAVSHCQAFTSLLLQPGTPFLSYLVNIFLSFWFGRRCYCLQEVFPVTLLWLVGLESLFGIFITGLGFNRSIVEHTAIRKSTLKECFLCSRSGTKQWTCIDVFSFHSIPMKWEAF